MKRIGIWLLAALLALPGMAMGTEEGTAKPFLELEEGTTEGMGEDAITGPAEGAGEEKPATESVEGVPIEVIAPGFTYLTLGTEAAGLVRLPRDGTQVAGGLFILEDGYLSIGYERFDPYTIGVLPEGQPLTCLNADLSTRWVLDDARLAGAWYTELLELPDALLLYGDRSATGGSGQVPSLLLVDKEAGDIRWQLEGHCSGVWIAKALTDIDGNILVASNGVLDSHNGGTGVLSLVEAGDGSVRWAQEYFGRYGITRVADICPLGDGLLLYGKTEAEDVVLYTDRRGNVRGYFTFRAWQDAYEGHAALWLKSAGEGVAYLCGWETETGTDPHADLPYDNRTLCLMRIDAATFTPDHTWWGAK